MNKFIWIPFVLFLALGAWAFYENHLPVVAFLWAGFVAFAYWSIKTEKFKTGAIRGFVVGILMDFILLFVLHKMNPEDDIAGFVIISLLASGLLFALIGHVIQNYVLKKS
jgi:ABC-type uncharacterized transport system permease subunit